MAACVQLTPSFELRNEITPLPFQSHRHMQQISESLNVLSYISHPSLDLISDA